MRMLAAQYQTTAEGAIVALPELWIKCDTEFW